MRFDIRGYYKTGNAPYTAQFSEDFSGEDFSGSTLCAPVRCIFRAQPEADGVAMCLEIQAQADVACARCLAPVHRSYAFSTDYLVKMRELDDPDFELPLDEKGCLDLRELTCQELVLQIPRVLLCSTDCQGLCPVCGRRKADGCTCVSADAAPADVRLSILKQLLS